MKTAIRYYAVLLSLHAVAFSAAQPVVDQIPTRVVVQNGNATLLLADIPPAVASSAFVPASVPVVTYCRMEAKSRDRSLSPRANRPSSHRAKWPARSF